MWVELSGPVSYILFRAASAKSDKTWVQPINRQEEGDSWSGFNFRK